ncbi:MAG: hypothetical protein Q4G08_00340 [Capnocytophaga sp.]|nr:hypothetical protein [Capnocytophaga sp.]
MLCWIIPIIVGLICALLGYLLGQLRSGDKLKKCNQMQDILKDEKEKLAQTYEEKLKIKEREIFDLKSKVDNLEKSTEALSGTEKFVLSYEEKLRGKDTEIANLKSRLANLDTQIASFANMPADLPFDAAAAKLVYGKTIKQDDLTLVEGIGPKIQELFKSNSIPTWKVLSETTPERLKEILDAGGERFAIHNPGTWPRQALLAYQGKWQELKEWQDTLFGGVEPQS